MRLQIVKSKNATSLYIIKSVRINGHNTSKVVEKLGTLNELSKIHDDPIAWGKKYAKELTQKELQDKKEILVKCKPSTQITKNKTFSFNGGYLFLQQLYHELRLDKICSDISHKYKFTYNLDSILSRLIYGRIIFPTSKLGTFQLAEKFLENPEFNIQHIYRSLEVIAAETDFIQSELYKNSLRISKRNDRILYYDCTNYFFEIEQEEGIKQYGPSKEHRPNPIVEMGLFMDGDGIPLAFSIHSGNTNEQTTLMPLEKKIMKDFELSKFVVCTDAGLSSNDNRKFNNIGNRAFITTQSIKKLKKHLKEWAITESGWKISGDKTNTEYNISKLDCKEDGTSKYQNCSFYKERWIKENGLEQKLIVTFSLKYRDYQRSIRNRQIERARKLIETSPGNIQKHRQNDYKRFVKDTSITVDGEVANHKIYDINADTIASEEMFDGFYAVCTNLEDDAAEIAKINHSRWEIEECFRIMKSDFKARPVYLKKDDRIKAHFTTCFLALTLFRYLENRLNYKYTSTAIIDTLRDMNFYSIPGEGYIPTYTRTNLTDDLHDAFGFHTDFQIVTEKNMKKIFKGTKK